MRDPSAAPRGRSLPAALTRAAKAVMPFVLPLALAACSGGTERAASATTASDSAGLRVVTIAGDPRQLPALTVGDTLPLRGAAEDLFNGNPQFAFALNDGRLLLSDGRAIAVFDAAGGYVGPFSRAGQGPGEIANLSRVWRLPGDSIWVLDASNRRLSLFSPTLEFVRSVQQPSPSGGGPGFAIWSGLHGDTTTAIAYLRSGGPPGAGLTTQRVQLGLWVIGASAPVFGDSVDFAQFQMIGGGTGEGVVMMGAAMGRSAQWQPLGRCMVLGHSSRWAFTLQAPDDSLRLRDVGIVRAPDDPADAVTPELRERFIRGMLVAYGSEQSRAQVEPLYRNQMTYPDSTPHFSRVFASRDGALWVQRYRGPTTDVPDHWTVVDVRTPEAWRLELPPGSRLLAVDAARALVATKDEDEVETQAWWNFPELAGIRPPNRCEAR